MKNAHMPRSLFPGRSRQTIATAIEFSLSLKGKRVAVAAALVFEVNPMAAKKRKVLEVFNFSEWAWQDIVKAPLPQVAALDPPPARWLGVQSMASIATGRDGKVVVCDAAKRDVHFALGYVEG